ncbi:MAG TPA: 2-isopropylmalate synthase [Herpetosiphonaceae bacterium]|jgi:2-isopropylmalate synthase|nr:2-isopropylmalate synthase [Herpetosiphonaceae bacterium]
MGDHVRIFDTTLRDGEQSPGCTMTRDEKLEVARQLARLKVDIIEAGFPAASPGDWEAVNAIAKEIGTPDGPIICGLARANRGDIDAAWTAVRDAAKPRIHTFISTSDIHIQHQLRSTREEVLNKARDMVAYARSLCPDVEFSPMDAGRSDPAYMHQVLRAAIEAGATTLNIPDTVGYLTPAEYGEMILNIRKKVPGAEEVTISTHCHDDLGMAVANSLAGVHAGARQVECTINGIGERAGNASLEEVVMAIHTRRDFFNLTTQVETTQLAHTSRLLSACIGMPVPPNKAIVGDNAFAHESGIHQDGMLKNRQTYEIMNPETVGLDGTHIVLGKHSGRHAFRARLETLGYKIADEEFNKLFERFKELADKKKLLDERDIEALVNDEAQRPVSIYVLEQLQVSCGTHAIPTATVRLRGPDGKVMTDSGQGTGPVDAIYQAINKVVQRPNELIEFSINAITEGIDAVGEVTIRIQEAPRQNAKPVNGKVERPQIFSGYGVNVDIIVAAAEAYLGALNKMLAAQEDRERMQRAAHAAAYQRDVALYSVDLFGNSTLGKAD